MHIHGQIPNVQASNFYGVSKDERAGSARQAAETRKRLLKAGQVPEGQGSFEDTLLIGHSMESGPNQATSGNDFTDFK